MSIDEQANSDLSLNDEDAENVVGGQKKKAKKKHKVTYIKLPGPTTPVQTVAGPADEDCAEDPYASDTPTH